MTKSDKITSPYISAMKNTGVVAIIEDNGKYLLLQDAQKIMYEFWGFPAGVCRDDDKNEKESLIKIVLKETDLKITPVKKLFSMKADTKIKRVSFWLTQLNDTKEVHIDPIGSLDYGWFTPRHALKLKLYPGTRNFFLKFN